MKLYLLPGTNDATVKQNAVTMKKAKAILKKRQKEIDAELKELRKEIAEQEQPIEEVAPDEMLLCDWMDVYYKLQQSHGVRNLSSIKTAKNKLLSFNPMGTIRQQTPWSRLWTDGFLFAVLFQVH